MKVLASLFANVLPLVSTASTAVSEPDQSLNVSPSNMPPTTHAEIVAIGDEITSGQLLDTNSQWLSLRLEELGVRTLYHSTVGDELHPAARCFVRRLGGPTLWSPPVASAPRPTT